MSGQGLDFRESGAARSAASAPPDTPRSWGQLANHAMLMAVVLLTRVPLIGNFEGEPDTARYVTGLHLWSHGDRANPLLYARTMSAGYYWLASQLAWLTHASVANYSLLLSIVSLCASVLMASATYELSRRVTGEWCAGLCTLLFLASPAIWWSGIQGHPQALAIALAIFALYAYARAMVVSRSVWWFAAAALALAASLLIKIDAVLLFPAFFGLLFFLRPAGKRASRLLSTAVLLVLAPAGFLLTAALILRTAVHEVQGETNRLVGLFLMIPRGSGILRQAAPMVLALGPVLFVFAAVGLVLLFHRISGEQRRRWLFLFLSWYVPGSLFWFLIFGNNPRHEALFALALLWAGVTGWSHTVGRGALIAGAAAVLLLNFWSIPANSDNSYLLSPNVPGSARALRAREQEMRSLAKMVVGRGGSSCFLGTYTVPYFRVYVLQNSQPLPSLKGQDDAAGSWLVSNRYAIRSVYVRSAPRIELPCSPAYSLEYGPDGGKRRFFGKEVYSSRIWAALVDRASGAR